MGGLFTNIGGGAKNRLAAIDTNTGTAAAWNPDPNFAVFSLALSGTTLYVGGQFTTIGGQSRNNVAAIDTSTGAANGLNLNASSYVYALETFGSTVHIGGNFSGIGGTFLGIVTQVSSFVRLKSHNFPSRIIY